MTHYRVQEWPDMPGDGDAIVFSTDWPDEDWERHRSYWEAFEWLAGNTGPGDTLIVLPPAAGRRADSYRGPKEKKG